MDDQDQANRMRLLQEEEVRYEDNARKMNRLWRQQEIALHEEMIRHDEIIRRETGCQASRFIYNTNGLKQYSQSNDQLK